jgi:hypothetical protein
MILVFARNFSAYKNDVGVVIEHRSQPVSQQQVLLLLIPDI